MSVANISCTEIAILVVCVVGVEKIRLSHVESNLTRKMLISVTAVVNTKTGFVDDMDFQVIEGGIW